MLTTAQFPQVTLVFKLENFELSILPLAGTARLSGVGWAEPASVAWLGLMIKGRNVDVCKGVNGKDLCDESAENMVFVLRILENHCNTK